jgi:hypothetical protein
MGCKDNMRNLHFKIIILILITSCSHIGIYEELGTYFKNIFSEPDDLSPEEVNRVKFASIQMRLGNNPNTLIVLEEDKQGILKWTSSNAVKIYTNKGIITRFMGIENELDILEVDKDHPILKASLSKEKVINLTSFYTFRNPDLFRLPIKTKFYYSDSEDLDILGENYKVDIYKEEAQDNLINWKFTNFFWVNQKTKKVIKSIQAITPKNPKVHFTVTKDYVKQ